MSQPWYIGSGTAPRVSSDTRLIRWTKILGLIQNMAGAKAQNNPKRQDTLRIIMAKLNSAVHSTIP